MGRNYWLIVNGKGQPLYLESDKKLWIFRYKKEALEFTKNRKIDKEFNKIRNIIKIRLVKR